MDSLREAGLDRILITHHSPLAERKRLLGAQLARLGIEAEWVERYLPDEIRPEYERLTANWAACEKIHIAQPYYPYENAGKKLTMSELSLYLKHVLCLKKQVEHGWRNILILEDDVTLNDRFPEYLVRNLREFTDPAEFGFALDMLIVGTAFNFRAKKLRRGKYIHFDPDQKTRCTHAIVFNLRCVPQVLKHAEHINMPWDFKLNETIQLEGLKVAWSEPGMPQNASFASAVSKS